MLQNTMPYVENNIWIENFFCHDQTQPSYWFKKIEFERQNMPTKILFHHDIKYVNKYVHVTIILNVKLLEFAWFSISSIEINVSCSQIFYRKKCLSTNRSKKWKKFLFWNFVKFVSKLKNNVEWIVFLTNMFAAQN